MRNAKHLDDYGRRLVRGRILVANPPKPRCASNGVVTEASEVEAVVQIEARRVGGEVNLAEAARPDVQRRRHLTMIGRNFVIKGEHFFA